MKPRRTSPAEGQSASATQTLRRGAEVILLLWAWMKCWIDLYVNSRKAWTKPDAENMTEILVITIGMLITSVLGCFHFYQQGLAMEACMAALDLDTPFIVCKHGSQVVRGGDCSEWERLRLRNAVWRSLPLAVVTFVLSLRGLLEIPVCQMVATIGPLADGFFPGQTSRSRFAMDLAEDGLNVFNISRTKIVQHDAQLLPHELRAKIMPLIHPALNFQQKAWDAAHCRQSKWEEITLPRDIDASQSWLIGFPVQLERVELGRLASGNLAALNFIFYTQWEELLVQREQVLQPAVVSVLRHNDYWWASQVVSLLPWERQVHELVDLVEKKIREKDEPQRTVQQNRPWELTLGSLFQFRVKAGWKVIVPQTCILLVVALLPIRKKILETCKVQGARMIIVTAYTFLDLTCLVACFVLCTAEPLAYHMGVAGKAILAGVFPMMVEFLHRMQHVPPDLEKFVAEVLADAVAKTMPGVLASLDVDLLPALCWSLPFLAKLAVGSLIFLAVSAGLAYGFCGSGLAGSASAGVCGPLWPVADAVGPASHETPKHCTQGAYVIVVCRSLLFLAIVTTDWWEVDSVSLQYFFALISNSIVNVQSVKFYWLAICSAHLFCGLFAASAVQRSLDSRDAHHSAGLVPTEECYGTFPQPGVKDEP